MPVCDQPLAVAAYTSLAFSQRVRDLELAQSFGSNGDCYDNAPVEAFWATLKRDLAWIHNTTSWTNRAELRSALFDYIEGFYNPNRIQRRLGHQSPADYEQHSAAGNVVSTKAGELHVLAADVLCARSVRSTEPWIRRYS